jgi:hypothetical protein
MIPATYERNLPGFDFHEKRPSPRQMTYDEILAKQVAQLQNSRPYTVLSGTAAYPIGETRPNARK